MTRLSDEFDFVNDLPISSNFGFLVNPELAYTILMINLDSLPDFDDLSLNEA
jgi:hypothetical protein